MAVTPPTERRLSDVLQYYGGASDNNDEVILTADSLLHYDTVMFGCTAGAFTVEASLDGTNYFAMSFHDFYAIDTNPVRTAASTRLYALRVKFVNMRFIQDGATPVENFSAIFSKWFR